MKNQTNHGGKDSCSKNTFKITNKLINNNNSSKQEGFEYELNIFDNIIEKDASNINLVDDLKVPEKASKRKQDNEKITTQKTRPTPVTIANVRGSKKGQKIKYDNLKILLDSGCSDSIALMKYGNSKKTKTPTHKFATGSGQLKTKYESEIQFTLPEFSHSKIINWKFHLTELEDIGYDMIIGQDLMTSLGIDISFTRKVVTWEGTEIPMRDFNHLKKWRLSKYEMKTIIQSSSEPLVTEHATKRMIKILDSDYRKANLKTVVAGAKHLTQQEKEQLYQLLLKYESIFDGTLGEWTTDPLDFELAEGYTPHSQRHYPVPRLYRETFKKELDRLVKLGVLVKVQSSEWGSPTFIIPKKYNTVRLVSDFCRLDQKLKRKPYPLPRISDTLQ